MLMRYTSLFFQWNWDTDCLFAVYFASEKSNSELKFLQKMSWESKGAPINKALFLARVGIGGSPL